ncbi:hypothetical protein Tco_0717534 [Tanacetum coccineum]
MTAAKRSRKVTSFSKVVISYPSEIVITSSKQLYDVERLCARLIRLREMKEEVLVRSSLSSVWSNRKCDPVFQRKDDNSGRDAKIVEEPHQHPAPLLERAPRHTTAPAAKGALIPLPTLDKVAAAQPDPHLDRRSQGPSKGKARISTTVSFEPNQPSKKSKLRKRVPEVGSTNLEVEQTEGLGDANISSFWVELEDSLERSNSIPVRAVSAPRSHLGSATSGFAGKPGAKDIPEDDFATLSRGGKRSDLTFFPLVSLVIVMSYLYSFDGDVSLHMFLGKLWIILRRAESLLPLELLNRVNVLSALLVSHGMELNTRYTNLVESMARTKEKLKRKSGYVKELRSKELKSLEVQLADAMASSGKLTDELARTDVKLFDQALVVINLRNELALEKCKSQEYKDVIYELRMEITRFVGSDVECLVRRLLSSDEFHAALARVVSLVIASGVERELCMGRIDAKFEVAVQNVSNFSIGVEAEFNKALVALPSTSFPFLSKVVAAAGGALFEVTHILPDKLVCPADHVSTIPPVVSEALDQAHVDHASDDSPFVV